MQRQNIEQQLVTLNQLNIANKQEYEKTQNTIKMINTKLSIFHQELVEEFVEPPISRVVWLSGIEPKISAIQSRLQEILVQKKSADDALLAARNLFELLASPELTQDDMVEGYLAESERTITIFTNELSNIKLDLTPIYNEVTELTRRPPLPPVAPTDFVFDINNPQATEEEQKPSFATTATDPFSIRPEDLVENNSLPKKATEEKEEKPKEEKPQQKPEVLDPFGVSLGLPDLSQYSAASTRYSPRFHPQPLEEELIEDKKANEIRGARPPGA